MQRSAEPLQKVYDNLSQLEAPKSVAHIKSYWLAYIDSKLFVFLNYGIKDKAQSKKVIYRGIDRLENLENHNSEDLALLAFMKSLSIPLADSGMEMGAISGESSTLIAKAKELDPKNPRVYYVLGSSSYHTPKMYGGGREVEHNLTRVIALFKEQGDRYKAIEPNWGLEDSYVLLLKYYSREGEIDKGKTLLKEAIQQFPQNSELKQLEQKLDGE